jgi:DNA end-binding protein Ku
MHRREHVVIIRPGRTGIVLHTMFYESEIRREEEHRPDLSQVAQKELDLAVMLINSLANPFDSAKYRDTYREKLEALMENKLAGKLLAEKETARPAPVINILDALQRSLQSAERKLPASAAGSNAKQLRHRQKQLSAEQN